MFIDSHCHLNFPELSARVDAVRASMAQARVGGALVVCTTLEEFCQVHDLALRYPNFWASVGVHPDTEGMAEPSVDELVSRARLDKVIAVGETGLDYFRLGSRSVDDMAWQRERFRVHIQAALVADKPLIVHTRSAGVDTVELLRREGQGAVRGVFHCFTETESIARQALDLGFMISFSGILTFAKADDLRRVAAFVPLDRILIETDSPYLAPAPFRGRTNDPSLVPYVAHKLAELKRCTVEDIAAATTGNFRQLFNLDVSDLPAGEVASG